MCELPKTQFVKHANLLHLGVEIARQQTNIASVNRTQPPTPNPTLTLNPKLLPGARLHIWIIGHIHFLAYLKTKRLKLNNFMTIKRNAKASGSRRFEMLIN